MLWPHDEPQQRQQIFSSRSFGQLISDLPPLKESVAAYATCAAEKLRTQQLLTSEVGLMLRTNPFSTDLPQYQRSVSIAVPPTDDTRLIAQAAIKLLHTIYRPGFAYQKTGIYRRGIWQHVSPAEAGRGGVDFNAIISLKKVAILLPNTAQKQKRLTA